MYSRLHNRQFLFFSSSSSLVIVYDLNGEKQKEGIKLSEEPVSARSPSDAASVCVYFGREETQCDSCAVYPVSFTVHARLAPEIFITCIVSQYINIYTYMYFLFCLCNCKYNPCERMRKDSGEAVIFGLISTHTHTAIKYRKHSNAGRPRSVFIVCGVSLSTLPCN